MSDRISKEQFIDLLEHPQHNLDRWIDGTVASAFLGGDVDTGKFDESDFAALHKAVIDVGSEEVGRFVVCSLERLYELSTEDWDAPLDDTTRAAEQRLLDAWRSGKWAELLALVSAKIAEEYEQ